MSRVTRARNNFAAARIFALEWWRKRLSERNVYCEQLTARRIYAAWGLSPPADRHRNYALPVPAMLLPSLLYASIDDHALLALPRLRFVSCHLERAAAATTRVTVELDEPLCGERFRSRAEGTTCAGGDMRLAAQAVLDALLHATKGLLRFDLVGVRPIRVFDTNVVVAAVMVHGEGVSRRLVGTAIVDSDAVTGAALAALNATNRVVTPTPGAE